jgi:two-component system, chemotaxis family, chemotaxis protein CheY
MEPGRILIAEDNQALSSVLRFNLERAGHEVTVADDGAIAFELIQDSQFDVILTVQQMPRMTGHEFCTRMREMENYSSIPVIMLTAKGLELELSELKNELGISSTFIKPFSPSAVVREVDECLESSRQTLEQ